MYDYEYLVMALDELISHNVAGIICMENYKNCYFPNGFRKVFDLFCEIKHEYEQDQEEYFEKGSEIMKKAKFQMQCRAKREKLLKKYIEELEAIDPEIDYEKAVKDYYTTLEQEDIQTTEMQLSIYLYLISLIREKEEKV